MESLVSYNECFVRDNVFHCDLSLWAFLFFFKSIDIEVVVGERHEFQVRDETEDGGAPS